jgi:hypothetical protein
MCSNGGTCISDGKTTWFRKCICADGWTGRRCRSKQGFLSLYTVEQEVTVTYSYLHVLIQVIHSEFHSCCVFSYRRFKWCNGIKLCRISPILPIEGTDYCGGIIHVLFPIVVYSFSRFVLISFGKIKWPRQQAVISLEAQVGFTIEKNKWTNINRRI